MRFITRKNSVARKMLIILLVALILIFAITPNYSVQAVEEITQEDMADEGQGILGSLLKQVIQLIVAIGDIVMGALNHFMLGADGFTSAMLSPDNDNFQDPNSWLYVEDGEEIDYEFGEGTINTADFFSWITGTQYDIPNFLYSPESIFANNIAALDVNFLNPNRYASVAENSDDAEQASQSAAGGVLRQTIADWYISFRNIAIVGLLSVLVYLGIRILISSTAADKAKYKESLQNWVVALCLVFFIHFIMSGLLMITDKFTDLVSASVDDGITVQVDEGNIKFRTNIIGLVRFNAQSVSMYNTAAYSILYLIMVFYTVAFTFMYFKRFLYMAFFTMIAPLVALTYPVDKVGDGKAQAFNLWFKEYSMNLILQPVHLILYVALVSSAMDLVKQNMIYAIVAIGFLIPAEKFIKKMFGMDKAETPSGFGSFAAGAATMSGFKQVASMLGGGKNKGLKGGNGSSSSTDNSANNRVKTQDRGLLESYRNGNQPTEFTDSSDFSDSSDSSGFSDTSALSGLSVGDRQQELNGDYIGDDTGNANPSLERQRMLSDREGWQRIVDDPNTSDMDREEALQNIDFINEDIRRQNEQLEEQRRREQEEKLRREQEQRRQQQFGQPQPGWRKKRVIRGLKSAGKIAYKGAKIGAQGAGIVGGAMVGLAAGAATGDFSKAMTYMGAGAIAGRTIGKVAGRLPENAVGIGKNVRDAALDKAEQYQYNKDKDMYGVGYAAEQSAIRQNQRERNRFLKDKAEKEKYEEMAGRIKKATGQNVEAETLMQAAFDYKKANITDEKQIETGLTMEAKYGGVNGEKHDNMIDIMNMTKDIKKDNIRDEKKRKTTQDMIRANVGENNTKAQDEVWKYLTEALGEDEMGRKYAINPPRQQQSPSRRPRQSQQDINSESNSPRQQQSPSRRPRQSQQNANSESNSPRRPSRPRQNPAQ